MSAAARWSYTAKATVWPALPRDDWDGGRVYGPPVVIWCDYGSEAKVMRDAKGEEFTSALSVYTEHAASKPGDMVAIGDFGAAATPVESARVIRVVKRDADTFDRLADDFTLITA